MGYISGHEERQTRRGVLDLSRGRTWLNYVLHNSQHDSHMKKTLKERMEINKYCPWDKKHTLHKETK